MKKYRWGIIGTGRIARQFAAALKGCADAELYAVGSRSIGKAESFAAEFGFERSYGSYAELAEDDNIDIIYIATPMASHYEDSLLCIKNGRNVLCEKSIALNSTQLSEMIAAAGDKGVFFMEAMWTKCRPTFLKALEWIKNGCIGDVKYIKADFCNLMPYNENDRTFIYECGGGALLDLGVYPITFAAAILGDEPDEIISYAHMAHKVDMSNSITLKYGDSVAVLQSGFEVQNTNRALIAGDKGAIVLGDWFHCTTQAWLYDADMNEIEYSEIPVDVNGYEYEIYEAHRCLSAGMKESSLVPLSSTAAVMRIMDKCRRDWGMYYPGETPDQLAK